MNSSDYALQAVKGIKKSFDNGLKYRVEQYMQEGCIKFYETSEISEIYTSTEGMTGVNELGELETPPSLTLGDGYSITISEERFGGAIIIPEKVYRRDGRDNTLKVDQFLQRQRNQLLKTNVNKLLTNAYLMFNEAFSSTSAYLAPDSVEICGSHVWNSGNTFDNAVTTVFDSDAYDTAWEYAGDFDAPDGKEMPLSWTEIVVKKGSAAHREAIRLFAKEIKPTAVNDINIYEGELRVVATPYITTARKANWYLLDLTTEESPLAVGIGEYPTMREPIKESNEAIRSNCTGFWKQACINMPYQVYGSQP